MWIIREQMPDDGKLVKVRLDQSGVSFCIIERKFNRWGEQRKHKFEEVLVYIDEKMPKNMQKGKDFILKYLASQEIEKVAVIDTGYGRDNRHVNKINFAGIRGISDSADEGANTDFRENLKKASDNCAILLCDIIKVM